MRIKTSSSGNWDETMRWLNRVKVPNRPETVSHLKIIGQQGVSSLASATPIGDTGETARGWDYNLNLTRSTATLSFINRGHPEAKVNVALLINNGHGTGTGGYVPPIPYIVPALRGVYRTFDDTIWKKVIK